MKQKSFLLFFYFNYISSFYLTKILLIITSDYNMTILVGNYFVVLGHVELFLSREGVGIKNECFTKTEERQLGSQPRCGSKMVLTVVTSILVTPPPTHCDFFLQYRQHPPPTTTKASVETPGTQLNTPFCGLLCSRVSWVKPQSQARAARY